MLRASSYNIYVDLPENSEDMLLVHGYSGAYDKVSRRVATYVRSLETGRAPKPLFGVWSSEVEAQAEVIPPSQQTIEALKRRGYLTELSPEQEQEFLARIANKLHVLSSKPNYIFMPTYDCNLRCSYCFQDHMRTNSAFSHLLQTIRREVVDRIFQALPKIEAYHDLAENRDRARNIGLFGGEPLMASNRDIVEYIINRALAAGKANFWAVTNGTDLHAYKDLLNPATISFLQITLDGPSREHDKRRIYADGSGSFERIAKNITMALELGVQVNVRMNIDRNNIDQLPELADEIVARGWHTHPAFSTYTAPIHAANEKTSAKTTFGSWELDQALNKMRAHYANMSIIDRPDDQIKNQARKLFIKQDLPPLKSTFCGAHNGMYIFDAFGDIYACWERTGDSKIRIGNITADGDFVLADALNKMWRSRNVTTNPVCLKCRYALYCGGGCAILAEGHRGGFFTNFCDGFSKRFRASVAEAYVDHVAGVEMTARLDRACDL